ncbi:MAG: type IV secretory system conjugative DNA transfer family protein [Acidobacteria bacterium]|nr:type IV secretory system conjugative DNA transfer family protein [Acidobacteriota bacterium]
MAKLVLFNLRVAAQDWKRANPRNQRNVILVIDELQRVAGENLQGILQDARSFGIHAILANQSLTDLKSQTGFDLGPTIMTNTRVKFFFSSPSERECHVYVERGKGFTEARQFPEKGNPWLKDLGPEEFAYRVRLAWPFSWEEYQERDALPLPSWEEIPGGDFYKEDVEQWEEEKPEPISDALPRNFTLIRDSEWEEQVAAIKALFREGNEEMAGDPLSAVQTISPKDVQQVCDELLASIADRGSDRSRRLLMLLFESYLAGRETTPTWRELWEKCWDEPLGSQRGSDVQPARTVGQAVYRLREILDRYFTSEAGQRFPFHFVIEPNKYRLRIVIKTTDSEELNDPPFLDSQFPEG